VIFNEAVSKYMMNGWRVESQVGFTASLVTGLPFSDTRHLGLVGGIIHRQRRLALTGDECGNRIERFGNTVQTYPPPAHATVNR
jgi:hypothetical protein